MTAEGLENCEIAQQSDFGQLYNAMIHPLIRLSIYGGLWYQGRYSWKRWSITNFESYHTVCHRDGSDQLFPTLLKYVNYEGSWCIESELLSKKIPTCYYPLVNFQNYFSTSDR